MNGIGFLLAYLFLENNGKNLKEFYVDEDNSLLYLTIANFCPNLRKLYNVFQDNESLKIILKPQRWTE